MFSFSFAMTSIESNNIDTSTRVGCFMFTQNLKYGDGQKNINLTLVKFGPESKIYKVIELQNSLISDGYLSGNATGYFGTKTLKAIKSFQKDNNIIATGYVGIKTQGVLRSKFCNIDSINTKPPICDYAAPPSGCNYIHGPEYNNINKCGMILKCETLPGQENKIKDCPTEKIINMMPVMCVMAPCPPIDNSYYIYKGERKEISDFDANYIKNSCSVKETIVQ